MVSFIHCIQSTIVYSVRKQNGAASLNSSAAHIVNLFLMKIVLAVILFFCGHFGASINFF